MKATGLMILIVLLPSLLTACPMCTVSGREAPLLFYGAFLLLPYLVFGIGFFAFRRIAKSADPNP